MLPHGVINDDNHDSRANTAELIDVPFGGVDLAGPKEPRVTWGPANPREGPILEGKLPPDHCSIGNIGRAVDMLNIVR